MDVLCFSQSRHAVRSADPQMGTDYLHRQSDGCGLTNHPVVWDFIDYQCNFLELLIRPEKEMERMADHARKLREAGICGEVYCFRGSNPELTAKINKHPKAVAVIDQSRVPPWNFYRTFVSRANRIDELRRVEAAFAWDDQYLYSYISIDSGGVKIPTFNPFSIISCLISLTIRTIGLHAKSRMLKMARPGLS